jgi:hypothetical protein
MAASCTLVSDLFFDPRVRKTVELVELMAENSFIEEVAESVWFEMVTNPLHPNPAHSVVGVDVSGVINDARQLLDEHWSDERYSTTYQAVAHAAYMSLRELPGEVFTGGAGNAAQYCARAIECAVSLQAGVSLDGNDLDGEDGESRVRVSILGIFRDIFGNPFRPVAFSPEWRTTTAVAIAQGMYDSRDFGPMPLLADALQDAGCEAPEIIDHCRGPGPHVRGCWVVDGVLGKA